MSLDANNSPLENLHRTYMNNVAAENVSGAAYLAEDLDNKLTKDSFKDLLLKGVNDVNAILTDSQIQFTQQEEDLLKDSGKWFQDVVEEFEEDEKSILVAVFGLMSDYPKQVVHGTLDKLLKLGQETNKEIASKKGRNAQDALNIKKASGDL